MNFNIDSAIFISFLAINLAVGIAYSGGIKNISQYAIGNKKFSTPAITATIVATFIGGGSFSMWTSGVYKEGLYYILLGICDGLAFLIISQVIAPRCGEFLGSISIASSMGQLYGPIARTITAFVGLLRTSGAVAIQFKVGIIILSYAFGDMGSKFVTLVALVVIIYSALGGIRAVVMTDIVQLLTFTIFIPVLALTIWSNILDPKQIISTILSNPIFDHHVVFHYNNYQELLNFIFIPIVFLIPGIDPAVFQRIAIASNVKQVKKSFFWATFCIFFITFLTYWVAVLLITEAPNIDPGKIIPYLLDNYSYIGLRGLILIGVTAMLISTADSYLNAAAILFAHDIIMPIKMIKSDKLELFLSRVSSMIVGIVAIILATSIKDILDIILFVANFYFPIVTVPFYLSIAGFRSSFKSIFSGMIAGVSTTLLFYYFKIKVDPTIPAILINAATVFTTHYLLKEPGGWVGINDKTSLEEIRQERQVRNCTFITYIKNFNLMTFFKNNLPKQEYIYFSFGLFAMISIFCVMHSISKDIHQQYSWLSEFIFHSVLFITTVFLSYPAWPDRFKNENFIAIVWNIGSIYVMIFASSLLSIMSNFAQLPMMILMINLIIIAALMRWQTALIMLVIGVYSAVGFFKWQTGLTSLPTSNIGLQFQFLYALLLVASCLIMFFKPKQEEHELTEEKVEHLGVRIGDREEELQKLLGLKSEFLRNLEHEMRTPITGITSMAETLYDSCEKMDLKKLKEYLGVIAKSSERFNTYSRNILDLSKLSSLTYELNKTNVNLSELVLQRLDRCKKLYLNGKKLEFITAVALDIHLSCDKHYITSTIDNLIINAISYSKAGKITITLEKIDANVEFSIQDEGIGIPPSELFDIFGAFVVSSKTRTPAGGRGVGTALCKKVIEVHQGKIWAESDGEKGATFRFVLPCVKGS